MGKRICKECGKWSSTATYACEHCRAMLYTEKEMKFLFIAAAIHRRRRDPHRAGGGAHPLVAQGSAFSPGGLSFLRHRLAGETRAPFCPIAPQPNPMTRGRGGGHGAKP